MVLSVDWFDDDDFRQPTDKAPIVCRIPEWSIQTRRRYFKHVGVIDDILDIENGTHVTTYTLALFNAHPGFSCFGGWVCSRAIQINPQDPPLCLAPMLYVEDFQEIGACHPLGNGPYPFEGIILWTRAAHRDEAPKLKKWARAHFG
jgi:hypothetical protein